MSIIIKIALRNIMVNKKRSFMIGLTIIISSLLLIITSAAMNGTDKQMLKSLINIQTGEVVVMDESIWEKNPSDPLRFLYLGNTSSINENDSYKAACRQMETFLEKNKKDIKAVYKSVRKSITIKTDNSSDNLVIYGLSDENSKFLTETGTIEIEEGKLLSDNPDTVCISREKAKKNNISIGDEVLLSAGNSQEKENNAREFKIGGIYKNGAGYDTGNIYMTNFAATELLGYGEDYFDIARIYLNQSEKILDFADRLDQNLTEENNILRAQAYSEASLFFTSLPNMLKIVYRIFVIALLIIVALGMRSSIKMYLYERMKEFGTLRAIGYSRRQCYIVILFEVLFLALFSFGIAFIVSFIPIEIFRRVGIYVGSGEAVSYFFAGDTVYPFLKVSDVVLAFLIMIFFSLLATLSPGLKLCYQKISDIMLKREKKIYVSIELMKSLKAMMQREK